MQLVGHDFPQIRRFSHGTYVLLAFAALALYIAIAALTSMENRASEGPMAPFGGFTMQNVSPITQQRAE